MTTERELLSYAYHEAGHAVVGQYLGRKLSRLSVVPDDDAYGHVRWRSAFGPKEWDTIAFEGTYFDGIDGRTRRKVERFIMSAWAGTLAEERFKGEPNNQGFGLVPFGTDNDGEPRNLVAGGSDVGCILTLSGAVTGSDREAEAYREWLRIRTDEILENELMWARVEAVAAVLAEAGTMTAARFREVVEGADVELSPRLKSLFTDTGGR